MKSREGDNILENGPGQKQRLFFICSLFTGDFENSLWPRHFYDSRQTYVTLNSASESN